MVVGSLFGTALDSFCWCGVCWWLLQFFDDWVPWPCAIGAILSMESDRRAPHPGWWSCRRACEWVSECWRRFAFLRAGDSPSEDRVDRTPSGCCMPRWAEMRWAELVVRTGRITHPRVKSEWMNEWMSEWVSDMDELQAKQWRISIVKRMRIYDVSEWMVNEWGSEWVVRDWVRFLVDRIIWSI
jgi:metal-sulfur cluster biosynthetic enzyme